MGKRPKMLASVVREVIAPIALHCPKECGITSITEIDVSKDFSYATVYISSLTSPERALQYFEARLPQLKKQMGSIYRKRIPELRFRIDPRTDQGKHIDNLLCEADNQTDN